MKIKQGKQEFFVKIMKKYENDPFDYGKKALSYAEKWANLTESEMENGQDFFDVIYINSIKACDDKQITYHMFWIALKFLIFVWEYSELLDNWFVNHPISVINKEEAIYASYHEVAEMLKG